MPPHAGRRPDPTDRPADQPTDQPTDQPALCDFDVSDDELRAAGSVKWSYPPRDVVPAWVAEMDVRPCPAVLSAVRAAVDRGSFGYPPVDADSGLLEVTAQVANDRLGLPADPSRVVVCGDVMAGVRIALDALCERGPVVVPTPAYPPFLSLPPVTGRPVVPVPCTPAEDDGRGSPWRLDLAGIAAALASGARTVLLSQPHNPLGRAFTHTELAGLRDVVLAAGARVVSDEIHAPLVLPGAVHVPYAAVEGTAGHVTSVVAASKAWNVPGLKCAQLVAGTAADSASLQAVPHVANHGVSPLGVAATLAAYTDGWDWLDDVVTHLAARRAQFGELLARHLPQVGWTPGEATYLAWVDARPTGVTDPAVAALRAGRVMVNPGADFGPGWEGWVRVNLATSAERLERVVAGLATAWTTVQQPTAAQDPAI